jgi:hypothetical protein
MTTTVAINRTLEQRQAATSATAAAIAEFQALSTDEQLGLLWVLYENMGTSVTPAALGSARLQFAEGLLNQVKALSHSEQMSFMRDLVERRNTPMTRAYGVLTNNTKLAFWYKLAELMETGDVVPVPAGYTLTKAGKLLFGRISALEFNQQITVLRQSVITMGYDPFA